jgi:uncharacterized membrane protein
MRLNKAAYSTLFSIGIIVSLLLIVHGKSSADFVQIWVPPFDMRFLTHIVMIAASVLFFAGNLPHSYTRELIVHPMLAGVILWGCAHLISNGDLASMLLFGLLPLWAIVKIVSLETGKAGKQNPHQKKSPSIVWDAATIILGMIAYSIFLVFHGQLFGFALGVPF